MNITSIEICLNLNWLRFRNSVKKIHDGVMKMDVYFIHAQSLVRGYPCGGRACASNAPSVVFGCISMFSFSPFAIGTWLFSGCTTRSHIHRIAVVFRTDTAQAQVKPRFWWSHNFTWPEFSAQSQFRAAIVFRADIGATTVSRRHMWSHNSAQPQLLFRVGRDQNAKLGDFGAH